MVRRYFPLGGVDEAAVLADLVRRQHDVVEDAHAAVGPQAAARQLARLRGERPGGHPVPAPRRRADRLLRIHAVPFPNYGKRNKQPSFLGD